MAIIKALQCDKCGEVIKDNGGFVVIGNVHTIDQADSSHPAGFGIGGGIVGNNIEVDDEGLVTVDRVAHYHRQCLFTMLSYDPMTAKRSDTSDGIYEGVRGVQQRELSEILGRTNQAHTN